MYELLLLLQFISFLFVLVVLFYIITRPNSKTQVLLLLVSVATVINQVGYFLEMQAKSVDTAILAVKFLYLGKPFIVLCMLFLILELFKIRLSKGVSFLLLCLHGLITVLVCTCEHHSLFYTTIHFTTEGLFPHLVLGHGIVYYLFAGSVFVCMLTMIGLILKNYKKIRGKKERAQLYLLLAMVVSCLVGFGVFLTGISGGYDTTSFSYFVCSILIFICMVRYQFLDPVNVAKEIVLEHISDGFLVVDNDNCFLFANNVAKQLFPDAKDGKNMEEDLHGGLYRLEDKIYDMQRRYIDTKEQKKLGKLYIFEDITTSFNYGIRLEQDVKKKTKDLLVLQRSITLGLLNAIESRDADTAGHVKRTSDVIRIFVNQLIANKDMERYSQAFYENVINAAPMHDLGKLAVPDYILNKPGKYTDEEYAVMKTHAQKGAEIINDMLSGVEEADFLRVASNMIHFHHEKWDGSGYPNGLKGTEIPVEARIMALADVFDALVSKRVYKERMTYEQAFQIIEESLGSHFDESLGRCFINCRPLLEEYYDQYAKA